MVVAFYGGVGCCGRDTEGGFRGGLIGASVGGFESIHGLIDNGGRVGEGKECASRLSFFIERSFDEQ